MKLHCVVPDSLRYLCIRWLLTTASIEPSSDFGAALKFLTEVDVRVGDPDPGPGPDPDTALAFMVVAVQKERQYAGARWLNPRFPRLEHIIANLLWDSQHNSYTPPPLIARVNGKELMARVNGHHYSHNRIVHVGGFRCSSPDCRWWLYR